MSTIYQTRILDSATRELGKLPKSVVQKVIKRIRWLGENADKVNHESLKGDLSEFFKLRTGDYRILYEVLQNEKIIVIHAIGHRKDIYRKRRNL